MVDVLGELVTNYYNIRAKVAPVLHRGPRTEHPLAHELKKNGVLVLKNLFPEKDIHKINEQNKSYFNFDNPRELIASPDGKILLEGTAITKSDLEKFYFLHVKNYPDKIPAHKLILAYIYPILSAYYKSHFYVRDLYCYRNQPIPQARGSYE